MDDTQTIETPVETPAAGEGSPDTGTKEKSYTHAELVGELLGNRPHGSQVKVLAQEVFGPALLSGKEKNIISAACVDVIGGELAEYFPKSVWQDIARTGNKSEVIERVRKAAGALQRSRDAIKATVCARIDEITDTMFLVADGRQNMAGGMAGAEWLASVFNVRPDRVTEKKIAIHQLFGKEPEKSKSVKK
jgi:hypothetical protein